MASIGTFSPAGDGFCGTIETFITSLDVRIESTGVTEGHAAPGYRVYRGAAEIGAAWTRRTKAKRRYLLVRIDDPSLAQPVECRLVQGADAWQLMWSRE